MKRGVWSPLFVGIIVALVLLGLVLYFLFSQGGGIMDWISSLG